MLQLLQNTLGRMRFIAFAEGISYLILLFIAMPLKYVWGHPMAVRSFGSVHGFLFELYVLFVYLCYKQYGWSIRKTAILLLISLVPFGNFYADRHYLQSENQ